MNGSRNCIRKKYSLNLHCLNTNSDLYCSSSKCMAYITITVQAVLYCLISVHIHFHNALCACICVCLTAMDALDTGFLANIYSEKTLSSEN